MSGTMDIREVIAKAVGLMFRGDRPSDRWLLARADQIIAAIEAAPVELRLAWAARLVEAVLFGLVNGGGTPQTEADMARAQDVADR